MTAHAVAGCISYAKTARTYVIRFEGDIRYSQCTHLDQLLDTLFKEIDFENILIDVRTATALDSTSLGVIARIGQFLRQTLHKRASILSNNPDITDTLKNVGFDDVFSIIDHHSACPKTAHQLLLVPQQPCSEQQLTETVYEAHRILCELNDKNHAQFIAVCHAIKADNTHP